MFIEVLGQEISYQRNDNINHLQRSTTTLQLLYIHVDCLRPTRVYLIWFVAVVLLSDEYRISFLVLIII